MGKTQSRTAQNTGDANVNIINHLEGHSEAHDSHEIKLWIILIIVLFLALKKVHETHVQCRKRNALSLARSVAALNEVRTIN